MNGQYHPRTWSDTFAADGNTYDPSKFHNYSETSGTYLHDELDGTYSYVSSNTWHISDLTLKSYGPDAASMTYYVSADVSYDGTDYVISGVKMTYYNKNAKAGSKTGDYVMPDDGCVAYTVTPDLLN